MEVGVGLARDPPRLLQRVGERGSDSAVLSSPLISSDLIHHIAPPPPPALLPHSFCNLFFAHISPRKSDFLLQ